MDEEKANALASALGGETWQSGGDIWLVVLRRSDSHLVVFSDEVVCEYASQEALNEGHALMVIQLC
jgi:hypothetical protein